MRLFEIIKKSIYSREFYRSLEMTPLSFSIKYYYSLALGLSLALTIILSFAFLPAMNMFLRSFTYSFLQMVPDDIALTIQDGKVSINKPEPFFLPLAADLKSSIEDTTGDTVQNFLVVDTSSTFSLSQFASYTTIFWIGKDSVVSGNRGAVRVSSLERIQNVVITKPLIQSYTEKAKGLLRWLSPLVIFGLFLLSLFLFSVNLLYFFFGGFLVWLMARWKKIPLSYKKAYQIALHAGTLGLLLYALFMILFFPFVPIGFFTFMTVMLIIEVWVNFVREESLPPVTRN